MAESFGCIHFVFLLKQILARGFNTEKRSLTYRMHLSQTLNGMGPALPGRTLYDLFTNQKTVSICIA
jgi:hypothetical protein